MISFRKTKCNIALPGLLWLLCLAGCKKDPCLPASPGNGCAPVYTQPSHWFYTRYSNDWDEWKFVLGDSLATVNTTYSNDWDGWSFSAMNYAGHIQTKYSNDWDEWKLTCGQRSVEIFTTYSNDFDEWKITENATGFTAKIYTTYSEDYDEWKVYVNNVYKFKVYTSYSNDYDEWKITGDVSGIDLANLMAVLFVPVYTAAIHQQGIDQ